jgi:ribosomal subunit interface protein
VRVSILLGHHVPPPAREYAQQKLRRLERHASIDAADLTVERPAPLLPEASAELVLHLAHTHLVARCEAAGVHEAIDGVVDKADEQVRRHHDRTTDRKGRIGADAEPPRT